MALALCRVHGNSMEPTICEGDILLIRKGASFEDGDIVVAFNLEGIPVVKRVLSVDDSGVFLIGDNYDDSVDSRSYGEIPIENVIGRVMYSWNKRLRIRKF